MKTILFLTSAYPYFPGEQFIEDEIGYWAENNDANVIVAPLSALGQSRLLPDGIKVDLTLARNNSLPRKLCSLALSVVSRFFWAEVRFLILSGETSIRCYAIALRDVSRTIGVKRSMLKMLEKHGNIDAAYCYWNDIQSYAAVILRRAGKIGPVISRIHGFDLYEARRSNHYMPLKRQFIKDMDVVAAISNQGRDYVAAIYGRALKDIRISKLGVQIPEKSSSPSDDSRITILSVSFCLRIKRIDKIIDSIAKASISLKHLQIKWVHIGGGSLLQELESYAMEKLVPMGVDWEMLGSKSNSDVRKYYAENSVDIFLNASESEGVPVSIMEAMSYGTPIIAPDVGGISELVANEFGCLLSCAPSVGEIATAIVNVASRCKENDIRQKARERVIAEYSADCNYRSFVDFVTNQI